MKLKSALFLLVALFLNTSVAQTDDPAARIPLDTLPKTFDSDGGMYGFVREKGPDTTHDEGGEVQKCRVNLSWDVRTQQLWATASGTYRDGDKVIQGRNVKTFAVKYVSGSYYNSGKRIINYYYASYKVKNGPASTYYHHSISFHFDAATRNLLGVSPSTSYTHLPTEKDYYYTLTREGVGYSCRIGF